MPPYLFLRQTLKNIVMPQKKPRILVAESLKMIMWFIVRCFSVSDKHDRTSKVIWLSTTWLSIFQLKVADKKPLFTKPASTWIEISWFKDIIFLGYKILYPTPGWYARKMLFANLPKNITNWFLKLQPDIF